MAFVAGALVATFFLPVWRIDLFAPQYPEGLKMFIHINGLSGDVDIINGLNHYIGMKKINVAMFPEFSFLPYVVGFFMIFGIIVSITGNKRMLFIYIILTIIGGALALYDFYHWAYEYGHQLDPKAPIKIPGFSYQPPIFGHRRLLNFDAYSFPDIGGWVVIVAGGIACIIWFYETFMHHKIVKKLPNQLLVGISSIMFLFNSCTPKPKMPNIGKDQCHYCKMTISDGQYVAELGTKKGKLYFFDDLYCLLEYVNQGLITEKEINQKWITDYNKKNNYIPVEKAIFVFSENLRTPMNGHIIAFSDRTSAEDKVRELNGKLLTWEQIDQKGKFQ